MAPEHRHSMFRPCIDLHEGQVKQIVGGTLSGNEEGLKTNFVATCVYAALHFLQLLDFPAGNLQNTSPRSIATTSWRVDMS